MAFVVITKEEFEANLPDGFEEVSDDRIGEYVYQIDTHAESVAVRIYSTVDKRTNRTRDIGTDAIRVVFWDCRNNRPIGKGRKILRTEGATSVFDRLQDRISLFFKTAGDQVVVNFDKVEAILTHPAVNWMDFAQSLLDSYRDYGQLTEKQLAYVIGEKNPKGKPTMEARVKMKDPGFDFKPPAQGIEEVEFEDDPKEAVPESILDLKPEANDEVDDPETISPRPVLGDTDQVPTAEYKEHQYPFPNFNPVQSRVLDHIDEDKNMVIGAATSAGKTICAELLMDKVLGDGKKVIYLSPLKSLTEEKYHDWQKRFADREIVILTGDYVLSDKKQKALSSADIIVMTSEMTDSRTRRMESERNYWLKQVGLVVVDESHIITTERGHAVESGIMRFSKINTTARILFLSATMPNVDELGDWLTILNGKPTTVIYSTWRPVKLNLEYVEYPITIGAYGREDYWASQRAKRQAVIETVLTKPDEKFLVFVHDKGTGRALVKMFAGHGIEAVFHNADLSLDKRLEIEKSFENRRDGLRVLISTSTLAWGRNLPARNVVICGVHRGIMEVDELDIIQMAGRAGRYGIDDAGFVFLVIPIGTSDIWADHFANPRPILSVLNDQTILAFHTLAEIDNREIGSVGSMLGWYERSLAYQQQVKPFSREDAQELLTNLETMEMIKSYHLTIKVTGLGKVSSWLYFPPQDVYAWYKNFNTAFGVGRVDVDLERGVVEPTKEPPPDLNDHVLAWAIGDIPSNDLGYIPKDISDVVEDYRRELAQSRRGIWSSCAAPTCLAVYRCLQGGKDDSPYLKALKRAVVWDVDRVVSAVGMIDKMHASWDQEKLFKDLPYRIKYGVPQELVKYTKKKGIGGVKARKMAEEDRKKKEARGVEKEETGRKVLRVK